MKHKIKNNKDRIYLHVIASAASIKKILIGLSAAISLFLTPLHLQAEATKEYMRDAGIYSVNPYDVYTWGNISNLNFNDSSLTGVPEGLLTAKTVTSSWGGWGIFNLSVQNFSDYTVNGAVRLWVQSTSDLYVKVQYKDGGNNSQSKQVIITAPPLNTWREYVIPLGAGGFNLTATDLQKVEAPFIVGSDVASTYYVDHVRWTKPVLSMAIFPTVATVQQNTKRQFTVEGRSLANGAGDPIIIYSTFSALAAVGSFAPVGSTVTASTFTAGTTNGLARASILGVSTAAAVTVTASPVAATFGLLSETIPGLVIDTNSRLGVHNAAVGDSPDAVEGFKSLVSTVAIGADDYAGWYINWDLDSADETKTINMSDYYNGTIRFFFKATSGLSGKTKIGIRSGNVEAGTELSSVFINNSFAVDGGNIFDGNWHPIEIPVQLFAKARPWADLARMKVLFYTYVVTGAGQSASGTFYVDHLRWDTANPGVLHHITVTPGSVTIPHQARRTFTAAGFDAANNPVDIYPTWTTTGSIGALFSPLKGFSTLFTANTVGSGNVRATVNGITGSAATVVNVVSFTQTYNVYSDMGAGGSVGVSYAGAPGTGLFLKEVNTGSIEGNKLFRSTYTLLTNGPNPTAYANWFVEETNNSRFMSAFDTGYLRFYVRTTRDLQFSVRSSNILPGAETSHFTLSELGVPLDNNWQLVLLSMADFKLRDPNLDFTRIQTFFAITALTSLSGPNATPLQFDIDNVKWLSVKPVADGSKILAGLLAKQHPTTGLVLSFDQDANLRAVTYDNALAAMAFTYEKKFAEASAVLAGYRYRFNQGNFGGFHDEYKWDVANTQTILAPGRNVGPNAWLLLSIIHYRNATGDNSFNGLAGGIADWIKNQQYADGGVRMGWFNATTFNNNRSTEHNFDAYAAFSAYGKAFNYSSHTVNADNVWGWLNALWNETGSNRFPVGRNTNLTINFDRALDVHSWAPLALSSFTVVLANPVNGAEISFSTKQINVNTGLEVDGFDFSGTPGFGDVPADKDAVWLEGTAHMALAYLAAGNESKYLYYLGNLGFAIFATGPNTEGLTYATNPGTAYGTPFIMDATHASASSMAWYLFAKNRFNPFKPFPLYSVKLKNISNGLAAPSVSWTVPTIPSSWVRANQFVEIAAQPITSDSWGIQIYTENTDPLKIPRFVDPTPAFPNNLDSDPAGMLLDQSPTPTTSKRIPLSWRIMDSSTTPPSPIAPYTALTGSAGPESYSWFYMMDKTTPPIDSDGDGLLGGPNDGAGFSNGFDYVKIRSGSGIHQTQEPEGYQLVNFPDYLFFQSNFETAAAQVSYKGYIVLEFFFE